MENVSIHMVSTYIVSSDTYRSGSYLVSRWNFTEKNENEVGFIETPHGVQRRGDRVDSGVGIDQRRRRSRWHSYDGNR